MFDIILTTLTAILFMAVTFTAGYIAGKMKEGDRWEDLAMAVFTMGDLGFKTHTSRLFMLAINFFIAYLWNHYLGTPVFVTFSMTIIVVFHLGAYILNTRCGIAYPGSDALKVLFTK